MPMTRALSGRKHKTVSLFRDCLPSEGNSYPIAHMLSERHTTPCLTFFLQQLWHDFTSSTGSSRHLRPPKVVTDMTWPLLHAICISMAGVNLPSFIDKAWEAAMQGTVPKFTISLCTCHVTYSVSRAVVSHLGKRKTTERRAVLWLFGQMERASSVSELDVPPLAIKNETTYLPGQRRRNARGR